MAVVSADHADASLCAENLVAPAGGFKRAARGPRLIAPDDVKQHSGKGVCFWAVIDSFVVDCSELVDTHPGGLRKLLSADSPATGATGQPFGFSFSRGRNAHFPDTGKRFREGVKRYLSAGGGDTPFLPPTDVAFPPYGKVVILGKLATLTTCGPSAKCRWHRLSAPVPRLHLRVPTPQPLRRRR